MKMLLVLVATIGLGISPVLATDNVYQTSKKLTMTQFANQCNSMAGADYEGHGSSAGTCSKPGGYNITCATDGGITTCSGYDPNRPRAPE